MASVGESFAGISANSDVQRLDVANGFEKYTKDGVIFDISGNDDTLSSIITETPWNISELDDRPIPEAYFEVKFNNIANNSDYPVLYGVGIGSQNTDLEKLLGTQKNSFVYLDTGAVFANGKEIQQLKPFSPGMTVGAGILIDSFHQRRIYFTIEGQLVGVMDAAVHRGMDCFPGVTFSRFGYESTSISFKINLSQKQLLFAPSSLPNFRGDITNRFARLPKEIRSSCLSYASSNVDHRVVAEFRLVNKEFAEVLVGNEIWRTLFMNRWPNQNPNIKFKSWYKMFVKRHKVEAETYQPSLIENCQMEFECPIDANLLQSTPDPDVSHCDKCKQNVYSVHDQATLQAYTAMGRCVSFSTVKTPEDLRYSPEIMRGKVVYQDYDTPDAIRPGLDDFSSLDDLLQDLQ